MTCAGDSIPDIGTTDKRGSGAQVVSPARIAAGLSDYWFPRVVAELDDCYVKVAKVRGSLAWHSHDAATS